MFMTGFKKKRFISFIAVFLSIIAVCSSISLPAAAIADTVTVMSFEELSAVLSDKDSSKSIALGADITHITEQYSEYLLNIAGIKSLDLCGYSINVTNTANTNGNYDDSTLFHIESFSSFTLCDSSDIKSGSIIYSGEFIGVTNEYNGFNLEKITGRSIFCVDNDASLIISSGKLVAGGCSKQFVYEVLTYNDGKAEYKNALTTQVICGTVVTVKENGRLTIAGGSFEANGRSRANTIPNKKGWDKEKPASVCLRSEKGSHISIYGGTFIGNNGADVFDIQSGSNASINAGSFITLPVTNERISDYNSIPSMINGEYCGKINLNTKYIPSHLRSDFYKNGQKLESVPNILTTENGETVTLHPTSSTGSINATSFTTKYSLGAKGALKVSYDRCFIESNITYKWYVLKNDGTKLFLDNNSDTLNMQKLSSLGCNLVSQSSYEFGCIVTEKYSDNNDYVLTTPISTYKVTITNKNEISKVTIASSQADDDGKYTPGTAPSFTVGNGAQYSISSVRYYSADGTLQLIDPDLEDNTEYILIFDLSAKGKYVFSSSTTLSDITGGSSNILIVSDDGKSATISTRISTKCSHSLSEIICNDTMHYTVCIKCLKLISYSNHTYSDWKESNEYQTEYSKSCTVCGTVKNAQSSQNIFPDITSLLSIITKIDNPIENEPIISPALDNSPDCQRVTISSYKWTDTYGNPISNFPSGTECKLHITYTVNDSQEYLFSDETLFVMPSASSTVITVSEDKTEASVEYTIKPKKHQKINIDLPFVGKGSVFSQIIPSIEVTNFNVIWYKDGSAAGKYKVNSGVISDITDLNQEDGLDFSTLTAQEGSIYAFAITWDEAENDSVYDLDKVSTATQSGYSYYIYTSGMISTYYNMQKKSGGVLLTVGVSGVTAPIPGKSASKKATSLSNEYSVKSVSWSASKFKCKGEYTVNITITPNDGYTFAADILTASVNGINVNTTFNGDDLVMSYTFPVLEHSYTEKNAVYNAPSCKAEGSINLFCKYCEAKSPLIIEKISHNFIFQCKNDATCISTGTLEHLYCIDCFSLYQPDRSSSVNKENITTEIANHIEYVAFDKDFHSKLCSVCGEAMGEEEGHTFLPEIKINDKLYYTECSCGYYKAGTLEEIKAPSKPSLDALSGLEGLPIDKVKTILIIAIFFLLLIIISIITISVYLLATRRSYVALIALEESDNTEKQKETQKKEEEEEKD